MVFLASGRAVGVGSQAVYPTTPTDESSGESGGLRNREYDLQCTVGKRTQRSADQVLFCVEREKSGRQKKELNHFIIFCVYDFELVLFLIIGLWSVPACFEAIIVECLEPKGF